MDSICRFIGAKRGREFHQDREDLAKALDPIETK